MKRETAEQPTMFSFVYITHHLRIEPYHLIVSFSKFLILLFTSIGALLTIASSKRYRVGTKRAAHNAKVQLESTRRFFTKTQISVRCSCYNHRRCDGDTSRLSATTTSSLRDLIPLLNTPILDDDCCGGGMFPHSITDEVRTLLRIALLCSCQKHHVALTPLIQSSLSHQDI